MKKTIIILAILTISLLVLTGCVTSGNSATGAVPRSPPSIPTGGGGCGIAAPADVGQAAVIADTELNTAL